MHTERHLKQAAIIYQAAWRIEAYGTSDADEIVIRRVNNAPMTVSDRFPDVLILRLDVSILFILSPAKEIARIS